MTSKTGIKLREDFSRGQVVVHVDGKIVHRSSEYRGAAEYLMRNHGVSEGAMREIYADYKADYDERRG